MNEVFRAAAELQPAVFLNLLGGHPLTLAPMRPLLLAGVLLVLAWSGISPHDRFTWFLEVAPVLIGIPILLRTAKRFPLTPLVCVLLAIHACILMVGGKYTYAEVPLGFWVSDLVGWTRNNYDRLGHLAQGFVPAMVAREVMLRTSPLKPGKWLFFLLLCFALALSATYELIEWWTAVSTGEAAEAFLGTQGDVWDTQWDMMLAGIGALVAQLTLAGVQDRQIPSASAGTTNNRSIA